MADIFSKKKRSEIMSLIGSKNTKPEIALRKLISTDLYPKGYRYRLHYKKAIGSPDIVFVSQKVAIFADGSFWHGYRFRKTGHMLPVKFWQEKIKNNIARDKKVTKRLRKEGWVVLRFWEHQIKKDPEKILRIIRKNLNSI